MGEFDSDDHCIYYCEQEYIKRNGVALIVKKRFWNAVLGCSLKNDRIISVSKANHSTTENQVYAPNTSAKQADIEWFYDDLQDLLELIPKKMKTSSSQGTGMQK